LEGIGKCFLLVCIKIFFIRSASVLIGVALPSNKKEVILNLL